MEAQSGPCTFSDVHALLDLHRHHGGLVRAHSCLAALVYFFIRTFISNVSTTEHVSVSLTKAGEDGMYDQKQ